MAISNATFAMTSGPYELIELLPPANFVDGASDAGQGDQRQAHRREIREAADRAVQIDGRISQCGDQDDEPPIQAPAATT